MAEISLVFPHQLFDDNPALHHRRKVALIEDELFFSQYKFHKQKLILHRSTMRMYERELHSKGFETMYFNATQFTILQAVFISLVDQGFNYIHMVEPDDYLLDRRLKRFAKQYNIQLKYYASPGFLCTTQYLDEFFDDKRRYFLTEFYIAQRKRMNVLVEGNQPVGGKWTFDTENRKKLPATVHVPPLPKLSDNAAVTEAREYVEKHFNGNYGTSESFVYPVTRRDAALWLDNFLEQRFVHYGIYQDAIIKSDPFLFHSVLTPMLNIGLLSPAQVLDRTLELARDSNIPINSLEGFIRQVLGWREFVRAVYRREGVRQRTTNTWQHSRDIPKSFWEATTGVAPIDNVIDKVLNTSYSNHIERLMVMSNFMLLCEFDPDQVYHWFMAMYIDAYDWVMVPNVYGMGQFADGGLMSTKPYISGSNYILKMSDHSKGEWCEVWDALYWTFIHKHRETFVRNPRMSMMVRQCDKMDSQKLRKLQTRRDKFLERL